MIIHNNDYKDDITNIDIITMIITDKQQPKNGTNCHHDHHHSHYLYFPLTSISTMDFPDPIQEEEKEKQEESVTAIAGEFFGTTTIHGVGRVFK